MGQIQCCDNYKDDYNIAPERHLSTGNGRNDLKRNFLQETYEKIEKDVDPDCLDTFQIRSIPDKDLTDKHDIFYRKCAYPFY